MDSNRPAGAAERVKGSVKEAIGKLTGDARTEAEGTSEKTGGKPPADTAAPPHRNVAGR
jgi:uncharacterized protein YjbJ (UPF0337 family)